MLDVFLLPEKTIVTAKGDSDPLDVSGAANRAFLITLSVSGTVEQQSVDLSVFTSADGAAWDPKPAASLPQKFYVGQYPLLVDLSTAPAVKFLRVHWEVNRWGRGPTTPRFEMGIRIREVSPRPR
jgi:hypothetical protein